MILSTIKFIILAFLTLIGVKQFKQEIVKDILENPVQYSTSLFTGMFTYFNLSTPMTHLILEQAIQSAFAIFNAVAIFVVVFIVKKLIDPIWEQRIKNKLYKWLKLKNKENEIK